jgi:hypothetical protein
VTAARSRVRLRRGRPVTRAGLALKTLAVAGLAAAALGSGVEDLAGQRVQGLAGAQAGPGAGGLSGSDEAFAASGGAIVASDLEQAALRFARAWGNGDVDQVMRLLSSRGIRLRLEGMDRNALSARQANAALRDFLRGHEPGEVGLVRAAPVAGTPGRGFAELRWQTRVAGTSHAVVRSLFLGLVLEGGDWRVDELRLLP